MHIFISYSRKDSAFANQLCEFLTTQRLYYWMDTADREPGSIWRKELKKAIRQGYALLVIMSDAAHESTWVAKEIQYARRRNIPIIPVWRSGKLWDELEKYNFVEMKADTYTALPDALGDLLHDLDNAYRKRGVRRAGFSIFNVLDSRFFRAAVAIAMIVAMLILAWSLLWPDDASKDGEGTPISQVASATDAVDTPTPTITLTPSHTPNANEIVQTAAAATLTATAIVNAVDARVIELQTQQAATNAYFEAGTASAQQSFTPTQTLSPTDGGGGGGEPVYTATTPAPSATSSSTATPDWYATAATEIAASLTLNAETVSPTPTPTITRTSPRMTRTPTTTSTMPPSATPPPPLPTTPAATWTPTSTLTALPTLTVVPPSWTPTSSSTPSVTPSLSPTAPTMPPTEAMFAEGTPGIANNPSHMIIGVYAGPSYDSTIVAFLYHTQAISIMGEVPGWVFIGYGWVRFDRVFPVGDEAVIPIFQTQVSGMIPSPTTDEDFRVIESYWMTRTVESVLVRRGPTITPDDFGVPTLDPTSNRNLALTLTQSAANTQTATALPPTHTPSLTPTPSDTRTPTRTATASITPSDTVRPPASNTPTRTLTRTPTRTFTPLPPSNTPLPTATHTPVPSNTPIPPTNTPRPPTPIPQPTATIPFAVNITSVNPQGYGSHPSGVGCYANITVSVTEDIFGEIWVNNANWPHGPESYYQFYAAGPNDYTATLGGDDTARDHTITIITPKGQTSISGVRCG